MAAAVIFEPTDKYHGNDYQNHNGDKIDDNEGYNNFKEDGDYDSTEERYQCTGEEEEGIYEEKKK